MGAQSGRQARGELVEPFGGGGQFVLPGLCVDGGDPVSHEEVMRVFAENVEGLKGVLRDAIGQLPAHEDDASASCPCRRSLDGITLPFDLP